MTLEKKNYDGWISREVFSRNLYGKDSSEPPCRNVLKPKGEVVAEHDDAISIESDLR